MGLVYCIKNKINWKLYIGQTWKSIEERINAHLQAAKLGGTQVIHKAIRKYGSDAFEWWVIEDGIETQEELNEREIYWIKEEESLVPNGYNLTDGGHRGRHHKSTKRKISMANIGKPAPNLGIPHKEETKRKMSEKAKGRKVTEEQRQKLSESGKLSYKNGRAPVRAFLGRKHTQEAKEKVGQAAMSPEQDWRRMSFEERFGKERAAEIKAKMRESARKRIERDGSTLIEKYGEEKAMEIRAKISKTKREQFNQRQQS